MSNTLDIVRANFARRTEIQGELRSIDEAATADNRAYTEDETATIATLTTEREAIDNRIQSNVEGSLRSQQIEDGLTNLLGVYADRESGEVRDTRSVAERFIDTDQYRSWAASEGQKRLERTTLPDLDLRAVTDITTGATSGGAFIVPQRLARIGRDFFDRKVFVMDLLPQIPISGPVSYVQDVSPLADVAEKAVEVAEGQPKPQAGPTFEVIEESPATIAAWVDMTRQAAADAPQVVGYIEDKLRYSLKRRADAQIINGNGNSPNLSGLLDRDNIGTYEADSGEDAAVSIRKAITSMELDEAVAEIVVLNPSDAESFDLTNYATDGLHAVPNVAGPSARTAWGLTQVHSTAVAAGTAILIDPMAVAVLPRQGATLYTTDSDGEKFLANIVTLLLEMRLGLAVFDPLGVCEVTFDSES